MSENLAVEPAVQALPENNSAQAGTPENKPEDGGVQAAQSVEQGTGAATQPGLDVGEYMKNLPPEYKGIVEPVLKQWQSAYTKTRQEETKAMQDLKTQTDQRAQYAEAFEILKNNPQFQQWYHGQVNGAKAQPSDPKAEQTVPDQPEEITQEDIEAAQVDPKKWREVTARLAKSAAQEALSKADAKYGQLRMEMELDSIARENPDFWELDKAGVLQPFIHYYVDQLQRPPMEAYLAAKQSMAYLNNQAKAHARNMVQTQKTIVTEPPSATSSTPGVVFADDKDSALDKAISEALAGRFTEVRAKSRK